MLVVQLVRGPAVVGQVRRGPRRDLVRVGGALHLAEGVLDLEGDHTFRDIEEVGGATRAAGGRHAARRGLERTSIIIRPKIYRNFDGLVCPLR